MMDLINNYKLTKTAEEDIQTVTVNLDENEHRSGKLLSKMKFAVPAIRDKDIFSIKLNQVLNQKVHYLGKIAPKFLFLYVLICRYLLCSVF